MMRRVAAAAMIALWVLGGAARAVAEEYPARTVTIIVPYPAGGPTDETARVIANSLSQRLGQKFIVENITGGGATIATNRVAKAAPDGYTLLLHNLQISANATLYKNLPFDTAKDLIAVMLINKNPLVLVGRNTLAPNTFSELMALMKKQRLKVAVPGYGATAHLATALFAREADIALDQIPYRGAAPAITDLLGGHVDLFFGTPQSVTPQVAAGNLKAYAVTSIDQVAKLPQAQSMVKALGPKFEIVYWQALFAPTGTPDHVVKTLNAALHDAVSDSATAAAWEAEGVSAFPKQQHSQSAAQAMFQGEIARWGQVIRDNDIHVDQ